LPCKDNYDALNCLTAASDPLGNRAVMTDANESAITYTYDAACAPADRTWDAGVSCSARSDGSDFGILPNTSCSMEPSYRYPVLHRVG